MSDFIFKRFIWEQHCVPWKLRLLMRAIVPWQIRRWLFQGRINLNTSKMWDTEYDNYIKNDPRGETLIYAEQLYRHIVSMLRQHGRLLDAGCGLGVLLRMIRSKVPEIELHAVDISEVVIKEIRAQGFMGEPAVLPKIPYSD